MPAVSERSPLDASVVICAYSEERWNGLVRAVDSALGQTAAAREVVVSVDHNPELLERAREQFGPAVTVVANEQRAGLAGARNSGAHATSAPLVAFLDDDARAQPDWLEFVMKEGKERDQGIGYLDDGTMVVVEDGRRFIGKRVEVGVTSILQNPAGRMVFGKAKGEK